MPKEAVFTMKLEPELRTEFMAAAAREDRPASQILRELMRAYIEDSRNRSQYDQYLRAKVQAARVSMHAERGRSNDDIESTFAARRDQAIR